MAYQTLKDRIKNFQDSFIPTVPESTMNTVMTAQQILIKTGIAENSISEGSQFPDFNLLNAVSKSRSLADFLAKGPVVLSFYRGAWCPYCNLEINALQKALPEIIAAGAQLVAISPQTADKSADQVNKLDLGFEVLSDIGNRLAKKCGLVFTLPEAVRPIYETWQLDIPGHNGDESFELPIPATYIVDSEGVIRYAFRNMDYTQRCEPDIIIEQLKKL